MILEIHFESGEQGVNHRKFDLKAYHMDPEPDTIAPLLIHLADMLTSLHPGDVMEVFPGHIPELAGAEIRRLPDDA